MARLPHSSRCQGFTLVEAIMVIVITGIIAGIIALFIRAPVQGYFDSARRAELTDIADTAARRMARDIRTALPNSIRTASSAGTTYLEFYPTIAGGRYRREQDCTGGCTGNILDFSQTDADGFDVLGTFTTPLAGAEQIVIFNNGTADSDAYSGTNRRAIAGYVAPTMTLGAPAIRFPYESPGNRFHVVTTPVTYSCNPGLAAGNGTGSLLRYQGYAPAAAQPTPPGGTPNLLASNVSACSFAYNAGGAAGRIALVAIQLGITQENETVTIYHEVHVDNVP